MSGVRQRLEDCDVLLSEVAVLTQERADVARAKIAATLATLDSQPEQEENCICVKPGFGYDGYDAATAKPCSVHSPEYIEQQPEQEQKRCGGSGEVWTKRGAGDDPLSPCPGCSHPDCPNRQPEQKPGEREGWPEVILSRPTAAADPESWSIFHRDNPPLEDETSRYVPATSNPSHQSPLLRVAEELEDCEAKHRTYRDAQRREGSRAWQDGAHYAFRTAAQHIRQRLREEAEGLGEEESSGAALIAAERARQVSEEGWTPEHDDQHDQGELVRAAACYLDPGRFVDTPGFAAPEGWPWDAAWWKPIASSGGPEALGVVTAEDRIRNLTKTGALIAAEIDRLQRALPPGPQEGRHDDPPAGHDEAGGWLSAQRLAEFIDAHPTPEPQQEGRGEQGLSDAAALDAMVKEIQPLERFDPLMSAHEIGQTLEGCRDLLEQTGRVVPDAEAPDLQGESDG